MERLVPVDEELTRPIPPPDLVPVLWLDAATLAIMYRQKYEAYHVRMEKIRELARDE